MYSTLNELTNLRWSLDRITLVGTCLTATFERVINLNLSNGLFKVQGKGYKIVDNLNNEDLGYCEMTEFQANEVRFDFNPNKLSQLQGFNLKDFIHEIITNPHFSRNDVACDIFDFPNAMFENAILYKRCKYTAIHGQWGDIETHYWGSRQSEVYVRLYNKLKEQRQKKPEKRDIRTNKFSTWWRWEAELKRENTTSNWQSLVSENLDNMIFYELLANETIFVQADVFTALNAPHIFKQFEKHRKSSVRKAIKRAMKFDNSILKQNMLQSFERDEQELRDELNFWLNKLDIKKVAPDQDSNFEKTTL